MDHPLVYEINTRCWLKDLSRQAGRTVTLREVPDAELAAWQRFGCTHIWLMGVWSTGPKAREEALASTGLREACRQGLPDYTDEDLGASPYAIARYRVADDLGGEAGLAEFRRRLNAAGLKLFLDFVPNHLGVDHAWVRERPDLLVQLDAGSAAALPVHAGGMPRFIAHGKDPFFPPWTDTVQLDYRRAETREAMMELLVAVAQRCDGVRCDMAMLVLNEVFVKTWGPQAEGCAPMQEEFWQTAISRVKRALPGFQFLAEAYWGLEPQLQALGFDFTYDKTLLDFLVARDPAGTANHVRNLQASVLERSAHFLENHDEPRIASRMSPAEHCAAAFLILALPGMRFLHEGQLTGAKLRLPVQLRRRHVEPNDPEIVAIYERLLSAVQRSSVGHGPWRMIQPQPAWPGNPTAGNFVLVQWQNPAGGFDLAVVNLAPHQGQCLARIGSPQPGRATWSFCDLLSEAAFQISGEELEGRGLLLDLPAHGIQLLHGEMCDRPSSRTIPT